MTFLHSTPGAIALIVVLYPPLLALTRRAVRAAGLEED